MFKQPTRPISETSTQAEFNLAGLTEFNPALVYGFDPEASCTYGDQTSVEYLQHSAGQYQDMFNAYLYAQNTILPAIQNIGVANITPIQLLEWLDQIHLRIAATLAKDHVLGGFKGVIAGEYTKRQISRWLTNSDMHAHFSIYLSGSSSLHKLLSFTQKHGVKNKDTQKFIKLLTRIRDDESIQIPEDQKPFIEWNTPTSKGDITFTKLAACYHTKQLSLEEKNIVDKFKKICMPPAQYPQARQDFANALLAKWRECNTNNLDQIAELAYAAFYGITDIHWYFNANGRTATCFINCLLRSFGKPSILIRLPSERNNTASSYSQAIANIDKQPGLFTQHLKTRIQETEKQGGYQDKELGEVIKLRVQLAELTIKIKNEFPAYRLQEYYTAVLLQANDNIIMKKALLCDANKEMIIALNVMIESLSKVYAQLTQCLNSVSVPISPVVQRQYTPDEKKTIIEILESITGEKGWKIYKKNGLTILLELSDKNRATIIVAKLTETKAVRVELLQNVQTKIPVISLDSINLDKLLSLKLPPEACHQYVPLILKTP